MNDKLHEVLAKIGECYKDAISKDSRFYIEINIGKQAEELGFGNMKSDYRDVDAIVPLKKPVKGMKVRVDGRTFVNYAQFESGVVVPEYVARNAGLTYRSFVPNDSMILNYC
jgi:hypothetical protein